ncbi:MAG: murein hydrolase activator EnvC [Actinomycetota bacterium]|nr:peptidoglycan DD-metalloendopeptidase family protein [Actinomycetota bacterium]
MRKAGARRAVIAGLSLLLISTTFAPAAHARSNADRLSETRRQLRAARARLYQAKSTDAQLLATIHSIAAQLNTQTSRLALIRGRYALVRARIAASERHLAKLDARRAAFAAEIGARARDLYIMGPGAAEAWLTSGSMSEFLGRSTAMESVMTFDKTKVEDIVRIRHEETVVRTVLLRERSREAAAARDVADQVSLVADVLSTHRQAESAFARRVDAYESEVRALQAEQNHILFLIRSRGSINTGAVSRRGFVWPIRGQITSPYGPRGSGFHTGVDIDCRTGDPIGASKAGRVIAAEWGGGYGNMVIIDHGGGVSTLYAHNSKLLVHDGQQVTQRQKISLCGATGNATGDHLHFEVRINGQHTNPMNFLP